MTIAYALCLSLHKPLARAFLGPSQHPPPSHPGSVDPAQAYNCCDEPLSYGRRDCQHHQMPKKHQITWRVRPARQDRWPRSWCHRVHFLESVGEGILAGRLVNCIPAVILQKGDEMNCSHHNGISLSPQKAPGAKRSGQPQSGLRPCLLLGMAMGAPGPTIGWELTRDAPLH